MQPHNISAPSVPSQSQIAVSRCDRWQVHQRLTELDIHSTCYPNGTLEVEVYGPVTVVQLHSVLSQFTGSRQRLIDWLERCWQNSH